MKDWRKGAYQRSYVIMDKIIGELARRLGLTLDEAKYITFSEIRTAFADGHFEDICKKAKSRSRLCCYKIVGDDMKIWEGDECTKVVVETMDMSEDAAETEAITVLNGSVAYKGYAKGIARIVLVESDMEKLKKGEILVSSATNPDLILAMQRAAAFVTDTGGIMSHAAIVSREMKKPCVVGTRKATKVIKDGDTIEVDADKGIVKIIK